MKPSKILLLIGVIIAIAILSSCNKTKQKATSNNQPLEKSIYVKAVRVEEKLMSVPLHSVGKVFSQKESSLSFKTGGIIKSINVDNGQKVKKNQVLARLNLSEIQSTYDKASAAFTKAERDLMRAKNLYKEKVVTLETLQNAQTAFDATSSDLNIVKFNLTHSIILAPSDGLILNKMREEGELTNGGVPVFEFAGTNQNWIVKSGLVDKEVVKIVLGDSAKITFDAYPNTTFQGTVTKIANAPNPMNGTYEVEISLFEIPDTIKKGFIAKVNISPSQKQNYKQISIESLAEADQNDGIVYKIEDHKAKKVKVKIETIFNDKVLVVGALSANDLIISEGLSEINENSTVEIL
ncbi:efflux RND transporter periplasmic adaptor subunit [Reichenbachiella sp. MALMAid0571]|uniref:efflux RND transporter periplasmic adaptor subunit n=1 Tax=Reichenbachiella sp. MALMAid0571 TaxID=3143939 RepID=UPI0032DF66CE